MPTVAMVEYGDASPQVRAIYDEIMAVKGIDFVPNFWKTLVRIRRSWRSVAQPQSGDAARSPGRPHQGDDRAGG